MVRAKPINGLDQARKIIAAQAGKAPMGEVLFLTPPGAISFAGPAFYLQILTRLQQEYADREIRVVIDCGDNGALAIEAIRRGAEDIYFSGHSRATQAIAAIAEAEDVRFWPTLPEFE